jgi:hypothetical protein
MKRLWLVIFVLGLIACESDPDLPEGILGPEKTADVVEELLMKKQDLKYYGLTSDSVNVYFGSIYYRVLDERKVNHEEFQNSYRYYKSDPKLFLPMWTLVTDSLKNKIDLLEPTQN